MKNFALIISIIISSSIISAGIYFGLQHSKPTPSNSQTQTAFSPQPTPTPTPSPSPTSTPTPEITWTKSDIITALHQKTGIPLDKIEYSLSEPLKRNQRLLIRGTVKNKDDIGGAGFFGYIDTQGVHITYTGQGVPDCSQVNPYGYPLSWVDYCLQNGQAVKRTNP